MSKEEIVAGLKNAIERGYSIEQAKKSFISAGYPQQDVEEAAYLISSAVTTPSQTLPQPSTPEAPQPPLTAPQPTPTVSQPINPQPTPKPTQIQQPQEPEKPTKKRNFKIILLLIILLILIAIFILTLIFREKIIGWFT